MKRAARIGGAISASVGCLSVCAYSLDALPAPLNSLLLGGGVGLVAATALRLKRKSEVSGPLGEVGVLPGVPEEKFALPSEPSRAVERQKLLKQYDRVYAQMISREEDYSWSEAIDDMKAILYDLAPEVKAWTGDTRIRMYMLLKELAWKLDNPATARPSLELLVLVLSRGGRNALEMARPLLREKILKMYHDPHYERERFLPRLVLLLDDYSQDAVERIAKEAIHAWGTERFMASSAYLGFEDLEERGLRTHMRGMLCSELSRAGVDLDNSASYRALELYHAVR